MAGLWPWLKERALSRAGLFEWSEKKQMGGLRLASRDKAVWCDCWFGGLSAHGWEWEGGGEVDT